MTCTPLGLNTHRLLVTGSRTSAPVEAQEKSYTFFLIPGLILLILILGFVLSFRRRKKKQQAG